MTEEEATEAMQVAMTVGATRMQVMLASAQPEPVTPVAAKPVEPPAASSPSFTAAEVVPQAGGG